MLDNKNLVAVARQVLNDEIDGLIKVRDNISHGFVHAVELILGCKGKVIVSGMGKSGHIGNKIAATLASTGTAAFFMHPAEAMHGDLGMIEIGDLLIAISYSGESDELSAILPLVSKKQVPVIAITGAITSTLARLSDCIISIEIDREACPLNLAPTTSTTATLAIGDALAVGLLSLKQFQPLDFALSHPGGSLGRRLLTTVADIMHGNEHLPKLSPSASLKQVVIEISNKRLGLVGIVDDRGRLLGVITDGDLRRTLDLDVDVRKFTAQDLMTPNPHVVMMNSLAVDALEIMNKYKITNLLVTDANGVLIGAFNLHDLFLAKLI